jgi:hypothetical protein
MEKYQIQGPIPANHMNLSDSNLLEMPPPPHKKSWQYTTGDFKYLKQALTHLRFDI